jgi:hypothetical protein
MAAAAVGRLVILVLGVTVALEEVLREQTVVQGAVEVQEAAVQHMVEEVALGF